MKAIQLVAHGAPGKFELRDVPDPQPGPGEVVVQVQSCGLNHLDLWLEEAGLPIPVKLPRTPGGEIAGKIVAIGAGDSELENRRRRCHPIQSFLRRMRILPARRGFHVFARRNSRRATRRRLRRKSPRARPRAGALARRRGFRHLRRPDSRRQHRHAHAHQSRASESRRLGARHRRRERRGFGGDSNRETTRRARHQHRFHRSQTRSSPTVSARNSSSIPTMRNGPPKSARSRTSTAWIWSWNTSAAKCCGKCFDCLARGGTIVTCGATAGRDVPINLGRSL